MVYSILVVFLPHVISTCGSFSNLQEKKQQISFGSHLTMHRTNGLSD